MAAIAKAQGGVGVIGHFIMQTWQARDFPESDTGHTNMKKKPALELPTETLVANVWV